MTANEFNRKWERFLEDGHYGMSFDNPKVIEYMDKQFEEEIEHNPNFHYSQIKMKFGMARVYANSKKTHEWEQHIDMLIGND